MHYNIFKFMQYLLTKIFLSHKQLKNSDRIQMLTDLNDAGKSLHSMTKDVIEIRFHHGHRYTTSILDVAEQVSAERYNAHERARWKIHMENGIKIWRLAVHSILQKLPANWQLGQIFSAKIHGKLEIEMPREWFSKIQSEVDSQQQSVHHEIEDHNDEVTYEEMLVMVEKRIEMQLAKVLLVYERLNAFYM
jgi:hypothetical protein